MTIQRLLPAEDVLVACVSADRTEDVGLCIVDAATLSVRGKTEMLGPRVRAGQNQMLAVEGSLALFATQTGPEGTVMVWAVDVHRSVRWALNVEEWRGHGFAGERVVAARGCGGWGGDGVVIVTRPPVITPPRALAATRAPLPRS